MLLLLLLLTFLNNSLAFCISGHCLSGQKFGIRFITTEIFKIARFIIRVFKVITREFSKLPDSTFDLAPDLSTENLSSRSPSLTTASSPESFQDHQNSTARLITRECSRSPNSTTDSLLQNLQDHQIQHQMQSSSIIILKPTRFFCHCHHQIVFWKSRLNFSNKNRDFQTNLREKTRYTYTICTQTSIA